MKMTRKKLKDDIAMIIATESITDQVAKGHRILNENDVAESIVELFQSQLTEKVKEIIKLSDKIESEGETTFEEWRAFKRFRNALRGRLGDRE